MRQDRPIDDAMRKLSELSSCLARAENENFKLRVLVREMGHVLFALDVDYCGACKYDNRPYPCPVYTPYGGECKFKTAMRELGIEL